MMERIDRISTLIAIEYVLAYTLAEGLDIGQLNPFNDEGRDASIENAELITQPLKALSGDEILPADSSLLQTVSAGISTASTGIASEICDADVVKKFNSHNADSLDLFDVDQNSMMCQMCIRLARLSFIFQRVHATASVWPAAVLDSCKYETRDRLQDCEFLAARITGAMETASLDQVNSDHRILSVQASAVEMSERLMLLAQDVCKRGRCCSTMFNCEQWAVEKSVPPKCNIKELQQQKDLFERMAAMKSKLDGPSQHVADSSRPEQNRFVDHCEQRLINITFRESQVEERRKQLEQEAERLRRLARELAEQKMHLNDLRQKYGDAGSSWK